MQQAKTFEKQLLSEEIQKKADAVLYVLIVFVAISLAIGIILIAGLVLVLGKAI